MTAAKGALIVGIMNLAIGVLFALRTPPHSAQAETQKDMAVGAILVLGAFDLFVGAVWAIWSSML